MDLDKINIAIRPRNAWEGVDLGFAMARRWFLPLWLIWLATALPLFLASLLLVSESIVIASLMIWWLKPLYEPPLLFWMSRAMFGERLDRHAMLRNWRKVALPQLFANLTWRRLSPNRSFYMPVAVLEGLRGKRRRDRLEVLGRRQQVGLWLTLGGVTVETILEISFSLLIVIMIPEELRWIDLEAFMLTPGRGEEMLQYVGYLVAMSVVAPFYVAGGFGLYLTRRSQLEGWDIELGFRRMVARRRGERKSVAAAAALLLTAATLLTPAQDAHAVQSSEREQARTLIGDILDDPVFGRKDTETHWKYVGDEDSGESGAFSEFADWFVDFLSGFFKGIAGIGEVLLWMLAGLALAGFVWWLIRNRGWMPGNRRTATETPQPAVTLFGLDVRPESLPDDIVAAARELLDRGDRRAALSLLYRGTLSRFIQQNNPPIPASATEGECLTRVRQVRSREESEYFAALTDAWIRLAYGHLAPRREQLETLCNNWHVSDENRNR